MTRYAKVDYVKFSNIKYTRIKWESPSQCRYRFLLSQFSAEYCVCYG